MSTPSEAGKNPLRVGVIGYPIGHSISPVFQQAAFDHLGIRARYEAWETHPSKLKERIEGLRSPGALGANVTVPHKEAVIPLLDTVDPLATQIGAVNTIINRNGKLAGYNTDALGFLRSLAEDGHFDPKSKRVLILGAGGAARAVSFALLTSGIAHLTIANRPRYLAENLVARLRDSGQKQVEVGIWKRVPAGIDLIVNCTPIGMKGGPSPKRSPLAPSQVPPSVLVYDVVYNPPETPLMKAARKSGAKAVGGLHMLVYQGAASFELWTGQKAPLSVMLPIAEKALS